jgi:hypothetical protein
MLYGQEPTTAMDDEPMMAEKSSIGGNQLRRPISAQNKVAREKAAIEEVVQLIQGNLDMLEEAIIYHAGKVTPVSAQSPVPEIDSPGFDYLGSSPVYEQLHNILNRVNMSRSAVNQITNQLEI